jgi:hypothetical protein
MFTFMEFVTIQYVLLNCQNFIMVFVLLFFKLYFIISRCTVRNLDGAHRYVSCAA